jgi:hypothetical protein
VDGGRTAGAAAVAGADPVPAAVAVRRAARQPGLARHRRHRLRAADARTTLWDYGNRAMPFDRPGLLEPNEVYAAVAYVLHLNGIITDDQVMNARSLPRVRMPNRDGFISDSRPDVR